MGLNVMVAGIPLIPQTYKDGCWYASLLMMYEWNKKRGGNPTNPADVPTISSRYKSQMELPWALVREECGKVGLTDNVILSPSPAKIGEWLQRGPLYVTGVGTNWRGERVSNGHVFVIGGIREVPTSDEYEIYAYDPDPVNMGHRGWRPIRHLGIMMEDTNRSEHNTTFLQY
ncbi:papain-like cysteine protease family protein [Sphingomonas immobilis]|uniref:Papain-like cysteine protease family protein n=1 Tax=Sphingomonas immobilis TaxID=3063997 RepID=A0ABT8ZTL0_9SPHN|nr:papain-like cysteine protease family protein [Sphingomonas sp. CA1-15]MDO7840900.1 papain-like cysteine protease family protein [Sphingomonas sp. CA1-15]